MKHILLLIAMSSLFACSAPIKPSDSSRTTQDNSYGYSPESAIKLGDGKTSFAEGSAKERNFLNTLLGANGEKVTYRRLESCCFFNTPNGYNNGALLEKYEINYAGLEKPIILYLNTFDSGVAEPIKGLTFKPL